MSSTSHAFPGRSEVTRWSIGAFAAVLAVLCWAPWAGAEIMSTTTIDSFQQDIIAPFTYQEVPGGDSDSASGTAAARAKADVVSTYQRHQIESYGQTSINFSGVPAKLGTWHKHDIEANGQNPDAMWFRSEVTIQTQASFADTLALSVAGTGLPALVSVEYVWQMTGSYTHVLDIPSDQQPLYRMKSQVKFHADAGGRERSPIDIDTTFYDPDAQQPTPAMWSLLDDDVNLIRQPIPDMEPRPTLTADLAGDGQGGYLPLAISAALNVDTQHNFLNDGASLNYFLRGETELWFYNSADLVGLIVRDEAGAIRTDVMVQSAQGVDYALLPEPTSLALVLAGAVALLLRRHY